MTMGRVLGAASAALRCTHMATRTHTPVQQLHKLLFDAKLLLLQIRPTFYRISVSRA